jgi:signal transduction histidine kinase
MTEPESSLEISKELAAVLNQLSPEQRQHIQQGLAELVHDLRQSIGIIFTAEVLLRRRKTVPASELELLDTINTASKRSLDLLNSFAEPLEKKNTP